MKKVLIASGIAVLALATIVGAQSYSFSANLTVGSTGADVVALQTWLGANGFTIPAIASGAAAKGYFGSQTKAAVIAYQTKVGLPPTGFVGPLTRGKLNAGGTVTTTSSNGTSMTTTITCPVGYTCTPNPATTVTAVTTGATSTTVAVAAPVGIATPGIPGTLAVSLWSTPSNGTTVYKGQAYDVASYKVQASASDMGLNSISLDFDSRIWLYAGTITIKDDMGKVVAQASNLNVNNFTELTVGSDYRITIPVTGYVIKAAATKYLTVNLGFLVTSDRSTGTVNITQFQTRAIDGTGVTDTETVSSSRNFSYQGSGSGQIVVTVDAASPLQSLATLSTSATTNLIPLAIYDIKSQAAPSTLQSLNLTVNTQTGVTNLFSNIQIKIGSNTYSASTLGSTTSFTNLQIPLAADVYTPMTVYGSVGADTSNKFDGASASTTWTVNSTNIVAVDASYSNVTVNTGTFISSNITFSASSAALSGLTASLGACSVNSNTTQACQVSYSFTLAAGNNSLYVSAVPGVALGTTTTGYINNGASNASTTLTVVVTNPGTLSGDSAGSYYVVPAGSSRQFTWTGSVQFDGTQTPRTRTFAITQVNYGTASNALTANNINYNLSPLLLTFSI